MTLREEGSLSFLTDDNNCSAHSTSLQHLEFEDGTIPMVKKTGGSGRMSPVRARTMKEYEQQIAELQKENFSLKLRIYFLEERMKKDFDGYGEDVYKINIELQVELESLKHDLVKKQELLKKASNALDSITTQHQVELQQACETIAEDVQQRARLDVVASEQTISELRTRLQDTDQLMQKQHSELDELKQRYQELLSMNELLDSQCQTLEMAKRNLELQLETGADSSSDDEQTADKMKLTDTILSEKDRLIEQLRCGLRAKDVIIEQIEEEKKELVHETMQQFEDQINERLEKLKTFETGVEPLVKSGTTVDNYCQTTGDHLSDSNNLHTSCFDENEKHRLNVLSLEQQLEEIKNCLQVALHDNELTKKKKVPTATLR